MMMSSVTKVKFINSFSFIKNSFIYYTFLGTIPKASQNKFHQIRIMKSKVIHVQIPVPKFEKNEKVRKFFLRYKAGQ